MQLSYVTGSLSKLQQAQAVCNPANIALEQVKLDLVEIQAETGEPIACHKAAQAFDLLHKPVVVSDDSWSFPGLNGFPGPYMKYINDWFTPEDWLRLTEQLADRRAILEQIVVYQDSSGQSVFTVSITAILLHNIRGKSPYAHCTIISFDDGATSAAQHHEKGESNTADKPSAWHDFVAWYAKEHRA